MQEIRVHCQTSAGKIRPMHGVNNGPTPARTYEKRSNFDSFAALKIPFVRNHDASLSEAYGSQHVVDVHCIFPDFSRDPSDGSAYDFEITDEYTKTIVDAGASLFYRLGSSIEHWPKKYGTLMPKDFSKWVDVCEHIIMHYTEGWANGFAYDVSYWEIWNEPDLDPDDAKDKRTWGGTRREFFDFYELAAKRLKARFPHLKIGGPALAYNEKWADEFLCEMNKRGVPIDFFSWHIYATEPRAFTSKASRMLELMQKNGYGEAESILNEWNFVDDWSNPIGYLRVIKGLKGSSFISAVLCEMQNNSSVSSMMYYDARVEKIYNGLFDSDTLLPLKGYYAIKAFSELYEMGDALSVSSSDGTLYAAAAKKDSRISVMLTNYANATPEAKEAILSLDAGKFKHARIYLLSEESDLALSSEIELAGDAISLSIAPYQTLLVELDML